MKWEDYYDRFWAWAESTKISRISSLTDFTSSAEVVEIANWRNGGSITDEHIDFAWFVQDYLERSVIRLINYAVQKTGIVNVCAAGGVFMLDRILWFLTDIQREVYRLVKLVGHTQTEAADILGTSIPNINKHLKKAMERIEEQKEKM